MIIIVLALISAVVLLVLSFYAVDANVAGSATARGMQAGEIMMHAFGALIVIAILVAAGSIYYYERRRHHEHEVEEEQEHAAEEAKLALDERESIATVDEDPTTDPVGKLWDYVDNELRQGYTRQQIIDELKKNHWPDRIITTVTDTFRPSYLAKQGMKPHTNTQELVRFIRQQEGRGYPVKVIKWNLTNIGWDSRIVDWAAQQVIAQASAVRYDQEELSQLGRLQKFVAGEMRRGKSKEHVRQLLVSAGWNAEVVDEELKRW